MNRERSGTSSEVIETNSELKNESDNITSKSKLTSTRKMLTNNVSNVSRGYEWQMWTWYKAYKSRKYSSNDQIARKVF